MRNLFMKFFWAQASFDQTIIETPIGNLLCIITREGLCWLDFFDTADSQSLYKSIQEQKGASSRGTNIQSLDRYRAALRQYFLGSPLKAQNIVLQGTSFQKKVWSVIASIPWGQTYTYTEIAQEIGNPKAYRAVARACGQNPICLYVPCHRVVASGGGLGGYRGTVRRKHWLLEHEQHHLT